MEYNRRQKQWEFIDNALYVATPKQMLVFILATIVIISFVTLVQ